MARRPPTPARPGVAPRPGRPPRLPRTTELPAARAGSRAAEEGQQVASKAADEAQAVASTAQEKGQAVVGVAARQARQVRATAKEQVDQVRGEVVDQAQTLGEEALSQLESQAKTQSRRLADTLSGLGDEVQALAEGRPHDADTLAPYVSDAATAVYDVADRVYSLATDIDEQGLTAVLDDLQAFARRRPGTFLLGAMAAGFGVGRAVRASKGEDDAESSPMAGGR